jgi:hypothetical protein
MNYGGHKHGFRRAGGNSWHCFGCAWCTGAGTTADEVRKACKKFKGLKAGASRKSYLDQSLKPADELGYAAAGVMLFKRSAGNVEVLLAREYRDKGEKRGDKLNWLGGKRPSLASANAAGVAIDKLDQETGGCLLRSTLITMQQNGFPLVLWSAESKYALHIFEVFEDRDLHLDVICAGTPGAKRLEWVPRELLCVGTFKKTELHGFTRMMLEDIIRCNVLDSLEALFDVGKGTPTPTIFEHDVGGVPLQVTFDVLSSLRESSRSARPNAVPMPMNPTFFHIASAVRNLAKADKRKLQRRFHPDHLVRLLGRQPTEPEVLLSTRAMQVINEAFAPESTSESAMKAVGDLQKELFPPAAAAAGGDDLAALLASVKLSPAKS